MPCCIFSLQKIKPMKFQWAKIQTTGFLPSMSKTGVLCGTFSGRLDDE